MTCQFTPSEVATHPPDPVARTAHDLASPDQRIALALAGWTLGVDVEATALRDLNAYPEELSRAGASELLATIERGEGVVRGGVR